MSMPPYDSLDQTSQHVSYHLPVLLQSVSMVCYHCTQGPDPDPVAMSHLSVAPEGLNVGTGTI